MTFRNTLLPGLHAASLLLLANAAWSQDATPRIDATRAASAPVIDGRLDEGLWKDAAVLGELKQVRPVDGDPGTEPTEIRVFYDQDALYIGAHMTDSRGLAAITANNMRQGSRLQDDDRIGFLIDPSGSGRGGYRFEVNLNGVRNDMLYQNGELQGEWDVIWDAAAAATEDGWSAEIAIPFKSIPNDPAVDAWNFNVSRAIRGKGEEAIWVSRNRTWGPNITGKLGGIREVDQGLGLDVVPTLGLRQVRFLPGAADSREEANPSLDAYYRITPTMSASLTLNTDFSGTDGDTRQVNLTRFSLFFPEKRDFFLKDADLFDFGRIMQNGRPFFSRKIGLSPVGTPIDIDLGGKVSGRLGRWRMGFLSVRQEEFGSLNPSTLSVARIAADVFDESSVGMIATRGDPFSNSSSSLIGADFLYVNSRFPGNRTLQGEAWFQKSTNRGRTGDDTAFGLGGRLIDSDGWELEAEVTRLGDDFQPALGFVSRPGVVEYEVFAFRNRQISGKWLQRYSFGTESSRTETLDGELESQEITLFPIDIELAARDALAVFYNTSREVLTTPFTIYTNRARSTNVVIPVGDYSFGQYGFNFFGAQQRRLIVRLQGRKGEFYDGDRVYAGAELTWKQSKYLSLRAGYDFNDIELPGGRFTTRILSTGLNVNFSSRLSWTNLLQYDNVSETAGFQSHLYYIPKAGREMVLIVNHSSQDLDRDDNFRSIAAEYGARISYTWRF